MKNNKPKKQKMTTIRVSITTAHMINSLRVDLKTPINDIVQSAIYPLYATAEKVKKVSAEYSEVVRQAIDESKI